MMNGISIKQYLTDAAESYARHADWERKRAEQAVDGCSFQQEMLQAAKFNEGRAAAYREILELIG